MLVDYTEPVKEARSATAASNRGRKHWQLDQDYARIRVRVSDTTTVTRDQAIRSPRPGMAIAELTRGACDDGKGGWSWTGAPDGLNAQ